MKIQESAEMYLETILILSQKNHSVRSIDIAYELDYKKPSVSMATRFYNLYIKPEQDHITVLDNIFLTF